VDPRDSLASSPTSLSTVIDRAIEAGNRLRKDVKDYTATLHRRERIGATLMDSQSMAIKALSRQYSNTPDQEANSSQGTIVSTEPINPVKLRTFSRGLHVYLKFLSPASMAGREVIWAEGKNNNQIIAHEAGIFNLISVNLDPNGDLAMMGSKYPITEIGIEKLIDKLIERGRKDATLEPAEVTVTPNSLLGNAACDRIRIVHVRKLDGFDFHIAEVWIDPKHELPVYYASYDWPATPGDPPPLIEEYAYHDLKINVGLSEADFDPKNSAYQFP